MATLTTGVVNAGFPASGATVQVQRGTTKYFSVVINDSQVSNDSKVPVSVFPQTNFTANTARASLQYNNSVTFVALIGTTPYQSVVKNVSQTSNDTSNIVKTVDVKTNPYYLTNTLTVNSTVNESKVGTTKFYDKAAPHTYITVSTQLAVDMKTNPYYYANTLTVSSSVNESKVSIMDNQNFSKLTGTRNGIIQTTPSEKTIFTIPNFNLVTNNPIGNSVPVSIMTVSTFNSALSSRAGITITTSNENKVAVFNINNSVTNLNSPVQPVTNSNPTLIVEQNNNSGRINSSAIQPKGTEAGNIGFAQAFGNTTIVGKWF